MATLGFTDSDGVDLGNKYVTKDYVMTWYPNLQSNMVAPQLWTWGNNSNGRLGDNTTTNKSSPVQTVAGSTNWKQVSGGLISAAIKIDGTLWLCGYNYYGQLGDSSNTDKSSPVQTVSGGTNWKQVAAGYFHTASIKTDGTLWTWGRNLQGSMGDNTTTNRSSPVQTVSGGTNWKQVACGGDYTAAIKTDGTLWMWGDNIYGALGDNSTVKRSSPVQTVAGGTNWKQVACGNNLSAAIKIDGTLWMWGRDEYGNLGDNTTVNKSSPVQTVAGGTNWKQVACGGYHTVAIKTDGTLWGWGYNSDGQLGDNTTVNKSSPIQTTSGGTNWKQVSCGQLYTTAIKTDGSLWAWGINSYGQLGDNTRSTKYTPTQIITSGANWKSVACGLLHTLAISEASGW